MIVISGPSGAGKTTIIDHFIKENPHLHLAVSATTRPKRQGEDEKRDYYFLSDTQFDELIKNDELIEYCTVHQHRYGTLKKEVFDYINQNKHVILEIDIQGARKIKAQFPNIILIFITPPSLDTLEKRLVNRKTDNQNMIKKRLLHAKKELSSIDEYDYIIENSELDKSVEKLQSFLQTIVLEK